MTATDTFFQWFYTGLSGLGGWFLFSLIALAGVIWLYYDSSSRRLPAQGWRLVILLTAALLIPAAIFRFSSIETRDSLLGFMEAIFYLGLLGGLIPVVLSVGYFVTYQGMAVCEKGHLYEAELGECDHPDHVEHVAPAAFEQRPISQGVSPIQQPSAPRREPPKPKAHAWLLADTGRDYQLYLGTTTIGRSSRNDIQLQGDTTIHREHIKIIEQDNRFRLVDLGGKNNTKVNSRIIREPVILEPDDRIELGEGTKLSFITSRR